jgi:methyl-accepting chemotaxis protein
MNAFLSLKTRIVFFFTLFMVILCAALTVMAVQQSIEVASAIFAEEGVAITETVLRDIIDTAAFEEIARDRDPGDPRYLSMQAAMLNRLNETGALFLYTIAPVGSPASPAWRYVIDGSDVIGGENFSALGDPVDTSEYEDAFRTAVDTGTSRYSKMEQDPEYDDIYAFSVYTPIKNSRGELIGIVGCDFDAAQLRAIIKGQIIRQSLVALIFAALGVGVMAIFMGMIFPRLARVTEILKSISGGDGDLTTRIEVSRMDEIGAMASYFNQTLDKIRNMIVLVKDQAEHLNGIGDELAENMTQTAAAINQITANIQGIKSQTLSQSASVTETGATMEQVTANINKLNGHVEEQSASVSQSSSAIEQMLANIQSVTGTLMKNAANVRELTSASEVGREGLEGVSTDIQEIARESEGLLEINAVMQNIASQTNLLSMNAAIEAAHAGEAGKGFAVVADEIRKLAEGSGEQSKIISGVLKKIKEAIDKITRSTRSVLEKFQAIDIQVRTVSEQEENIRNAMEEQGQGSKQILEAIGRLNEITQLVKQSSQEMLEGSREVINESRNLAKVTTGITGGVTEMASGAEQINAAVERVSEISRENQDGIGRLSREMAKFKVE